jgi:hypothetical protein
MIGVAPVDSFEANEILLCIMCLLQDVRMVSREKVVIGRLQLIGTGLTPKTIIKDNITSEKELMPCSTLTR